MLFGGSLLFGRLQSGGLQGSGPRAEKGFDLGAGNIIKVFFGWKSSQLFLLFSQKVLRPDLLLFRRHLHPSFFPFLPINKKTAAVPIRTNSAAHSCQSMGDQNDAAGSLTDGKCQTQQWTVVPDFDRITCSHRLLMINNMLQPPSVPRRGGNSPCRRPQQKKLQHLNDAAAVFLQTKTPHSLNSKER